MDEHSLSSGGGSLENIRIPYGGIIISTQDQNYAYGIYGALLSEGGSVDKMTLKNFTNGDTGQYDSSTSLAQAMTYESNLSAGTHYYVTYIITNTLNNVKTRMRDLYLGGYK